MAACGKAHPRWLPFYSMKLLLVGAICSVFFLLCMCMCGGYTCVIVSMCTCMYTRLEAWVWFWLACSRYPQLCLLTLELYVDYFDNWAFIYILHQQNLSLFCLNSKHSNRWATSPVQCSVFKEKYDKQKIIPEHNLALLRSARIYPLHICIQMIPRVPIQLLSPKD